ncbi:PAS domain S-box protein [Chloroflexota bacterium]
MMEDKARTKQQLLDELKEIRQRIAELEALESEHKVVEKALQASEEKFSKAFRTSPDAMAITSLRDGRFIEVNDSLTRVMGFTREETIGHTAIEIGIWESPEDRTRIVQVLQQERKVHVLEIKFRNKWGESRDGLFSANLIDIGDEPCMIALTTDITERKKMEEELLESEEKFSTVFYLNPIPMVILSADAAYVSEVNRAYENLSGYSREECIGKTIAELGRWVSPDDRDNMRRMTTEQGKVIDFETEVRKKSGEVRVVSISSEPITLAGEPYRIGTIRDITGRKRAEERIRYQASLVDNISDAIISRDSDFTVLSWNKAAERIYGWREDEVIGKDIRKLLSVDFIDSSNSEAIKELLEKGYWHGETIHYRKDGTPINISASSIALKDNDGKYSGAIIIVRDITEEKQAEEREEQLQQEIYMANRLASVGKMAAGIAHEINNPLTGVVGFSDLLMKKDIPEDIKKDISIIYEGAQRVASITNRMLTFARQYKPERTLININEIIATTLAMRTYEIESSNIKLTTRLDPDLPMTIADAGQLQQVFLNIVLNADTEMKNAHGGGSLLVRTEKIDDTIRVSFKDDGPGIAKENLDSIFDPFFTTRDVGQGAGLGLSVSYGIVTAHNGRIYARSRKGNGATFFIEIPIVTQAKHLRLTETAVEEPIRLPKTRVLIVDDDTIVQEFLTEVLTREGHEVEVVDNGDDALEKLGSEDYDVILLDIKLPGINGIELYKQLQKKNKSLVRRVIFVTGDVMGEDTVSFLSKTRAAYITKPFDAEQLKKGIERIQKRVKRN